MENKIPLPTDNVYKFYALFGLLTFIFSVGALLYTSNATNDVIFSTVVEIELLKQAEKPTPSEIAKRNVLERRMEIAISNRKTFEYVLFALIAISVFGIYYGFTKWHKEIQPRQDEMAIVQLETAKLQLEQLRKHKEPLVGSS